MNTLPASNLESEIISALEAIPAQIPGRMGDGVWTAAVKSSLIALGKKQGYSVCASGFPNECDAEWLYDLVWFRNDPAQHLQEVGLVAESEWSVEPTNIKFDFEKLLVARSPLKLMVFQDLKGNTPQLWSLLETGIRSFRAAPAGERYILACYQNEEDAFAFKTIVA